MNSGPRRRLAAALAAVALAFALAACGAGAGGPPVPPTSFDKLARRAGRILDGNPASFRAQIAALKGHPVVVNQWASWCGPCRFEFPFLQRLARKYSGRVAFLGVDTRDARDAARRFLRDLPVPYPHYFDPSESIARSFGGARAWPTTAYYNSSGVLTFTHPGVYPTQADLERDIRTHALR